MKELPKKLLFVIRFFVTADKLNTFNLLNKNTISPKGIMVLAHCYNAFIGYSVLHITFLTFNNSERKV